MWTRKHSYGASSWLCGHVWATVCRARPVARATFSHFEGMHKHVGQLPGCEQSTDARFFASARKTVRAGSSGASGARKRLATMMPMGVPRVPYRNPKHNMWQWVDIWNCLYRERICFLSKAVDDELGNQLVATMLYLDSESKKDISIYINASGGDVVPCLALHDTMKHIKADVATVGFGGVMGMAGFILACGTLCCILLPTFVVID
jgi:Clp protease